MLAEATALYRTGATAEADRTAQLVQRGDNADAVAGAAFLRGLIADDKGDEVGLAGSAQALSGEKTPRFEADSSEIAARLALWLGDPAQARQQAARAAELARQPSIIGGLRALWRLKERRPSAQATKPLPPISFCAPDAAPARKARRPVLGCGSAGRHPLRLAKPLLTTPPRCWMGSIETATDRAFSRKNSGYEPSGWFGARRR
ncbi:MAG: hypothetical protein ACJ8AH_24555 [Stellaceae bacterium]